MQFESKLSHHEFSRDKKFLLANLNKHGQLGGQGEAYLEKYQLY